MVAIKHFQGTLEGGTGRFHILFLFFVAVMFAISLVSLFGYHIYLVTLNRTTLGKYIWAHIPLYWECYQRSFRHSRIFKISPTSIYILYIYYKLNITTILQRPFAHQYSESVVQTKMVSIWGGITIGRKCLATTRNCGCCRFSRGNFRLSKTIQTNHSWLAFLTTLVHALCLSVYFRVGFSFALAS